MGFCEVSFLQQKEETLKHILGKRMASSKGQMRKHGWDIQVDETSQSREKVETVDYV